LEQEMVYWVEVHPANSGAVNEVLSKLTWLNAWLRDSAPRISVSLWITDEVAVTVSPQATASGFNRHPVLSKMDSSRYLEGSHEAPPGEKEPFTSKILPPLPAQDQEHRGADPLAIPQGRQHRACARGMRAAQAGLAQPEVNPH
jgi:hypothetical protein